MSVPRGKFWMIVGCMFSGKSSELVIQLNRRRIAGKQIQLFKPNIDNRYGKKGSVVTHNGASWRATVIPIDHPELILRKLKKGVNVVGIDEAQFFSEGIVEVCRKLVERGIEVLVAGLKDDTGGNKFGYMQELFTLADVVNTLTAICTQPGCGDEATRTEWASSAGDKPTQVVVGAQQYTAKCHRHWNPTKKS